MKTVLFAFLFALASVATAQDYHSALSSKSVWTSIDCFKIGVTEYKSIRKETMFGDTVINGLTYKKIYRDTSATFNWATAQYTCAVREQDKIVYYMPADGSGEKILYDFTKSLGDSVEVVGMHLNYPTPIKLRVDSVFTTTLHGVARKTYKFNANGAYHTDEYWYEGIGSSFGFLAPFLSASDNIYTLKCNSTNDTLYFLNDNISNFFCSPSEPNHDCEYTVIATSIKSAAVNTLRVYPNPVLDVISLGDYDRVGKYEIHAIDGRLIAAGDVHQGTIDATNFPGGMFILNLSNGEHHQRTTFVKQ